MRKEFVVKSIHASPDGPHNVIISFASAKDLKEENNRKSRFDPSDMMNPDKMKDMMRDLNKMLSGMGGGGSATSLKLDMYEYKELNLSVGDKVYLELTKDENLGV